MSIGILTHHKLRDPVDPDDDNIFSTVCKIFKKSTNKSKVGEQDREKLAEWAAQSLKHIAFDQIDEVFPIVFDSQTDDEDDQEEEKVENEDDRNEETVQKSPENSENVSEIDDLLAKTSIDP